MAYRVFIPEQKKRFFRKDPMYQVIIEDICRVFGYAEDSPEFARFKAYMDGKSIDTPFRASNPRADED